MNDNIDTYNLVRTKLLKWYEENKNTYPWRTSEDLYKVLVSEIFLQKTIASNVANIYNAFFNKYKDFSELYEEDVDKIQSEIKSLGLSNKRAKILKDLSEFVTKKHDGKIPKDPKILKKVNGIADYVSNAFLCFGLNQRTLFYDVNIKRFISRIFTSPNSKAKVEVISEHLDKLLPQENCKRAYWAILDFCSKICNKRKPKCEDCPLLSVCLYYQ